MLQFDGIEVSITDVEYPVGAVGDALSDDTIGNLCFETVKLLQEHMGETLDFVRVTIDDVEYGLIDSRKPIDGATIDYVGAAMRNFLTTEVVKDMLSNGN